MTTTMVFHSKEAYLEYMKKIGNVSYTLAICKMSNGTYEITINW